MPECVGYADMHAEQLKDLRVKMVLEIIQTNAYNC